MTHMTINPRPGDKFYLFSYHHQRQQVSEGILLTFFAEQPR
jgi:hypothetical protein